MKIAKVRAELPKPNSKVLNKNELHEDITKYLADTKLPEPVHYYEYSQEEIEERNKALAKINSDYIQMAIKSKNAAEGFVFNI